MTKKPNIILITIDCLRADYCGWLNPGEKELTPFLNKLAKESLVFTQAYATGPSTPLAFPGILTGTYPLSFKGWDGKTFPSLNQRPSLPEILKKNGYFTMAIHYSVYLSAFFGYNRGFDIFEDLGRYKTKSTFLFFLEKNLEGFFYKLNHTKWYPGFRDFLFKKTSKFYHFFKNILLSVRTIRPEFLVISAETINKVIFKILPSFKKPWFLFIHYLDVHDPYIMPENIQCLVDRLDQRFEEEKQKLIKELRKQYTLGQYSFKKENLELIKKIYQNRIKYLDQQIEKLFNRLENEFKNSIIVIMADHGQEFGEHGGFGHGSTEKNSQLYKELLHVPLIIKIPNKKSKTINKVVSCAQTPATILKLIGVKPPSEMESSLFDNKKIEIYSENLFDNSPLYDHLNLAASQRIEIKNEDLSD